jgi:PAS domain S-box-containing protein
MAAPYRSDASADGSGSSTGPDEIFELEAIASRLPEECIATLQMQIQQLEQQLEYQQRETLRLQEENNLLRDSQCSSFIGQDSNSLIEDQAGRERLIRTITERIRQSLDLHTILSQTVTEVRSLLATDRVLLFHLDGGLPGKVVEESVAPGYAALLGQSLQDLCFQEKYLEFYRQGRVRSISDIYDGDIRDCHADFLSQFQVRANLVVPILQGEQLWGVMIAHQCDRPRQWTPVEADLLKQIADQVGIALQQSQLFSEVQQQAEMRAKLVRQLQAELTERQRAELALLDLNQTLEQRVKERTEQLQLALSVARMGIWEWHVGDDRQYWSPENYELLGYQTDELGRVLDGTEEISLYPTHDLFLSRVHPDDRNIVAQRRKRPVNEFYETEYRVVWPDGTVHWHFTQGTALADETSTIHRIVGVTMDITDRKQGELTLRRSEEQFSKAFHTNPVSSLITRFPEGQIVDVNQSCLDLFGYQRQELLNQTTLETQLWHSPEARQQVIQVLEKTKSLRNLELRFTTHENQQKTVLASLELIEINGTPCILKMLMDISDRKQLEEQMLASLKEKEVLLNEIHHRVKNNLQIVSSLVRLQLRQVEDALIASMLQETQNRVQSMAFIHEQLYQSADFSQIDFGDYLQQLTRHLLRSYGVQSAIQLHLKTDPIHLNIDTAVPCGLIVNELVSNALKYAFPNGQSGDIYIQLRHNPEVGTIRLSVQDNGIGISSEMDLENAPSLGLQLVQALTQQIRGTLTLTQSDGTTFLVELAYPSK